jgi:hypothetical protein
LIIEKVEFNRKEVNPFGLFWLNFSSILKFMRKTVIPVTVIFLIGISLPYIVGWLSSNNEVFFTGFIANPLDSFSYLAKMRQGYDGLWLFSLPFSSQRSTPVFLFEYYIFLGHVARWLGLSLIFVFHAARIINSFLMLLAVWIFLDQFVDEGLEKKTTIWSVVILGSGLGWIAAFFQQSTSDLWVAEAYPFLSAYTNPHFPLAIALMLFLLILSERKNNRYSSFLTGTLTIVLCIVQPFCVLLIAIVLGINIGLEIIEKKFDKKKLIQLVVIGFSGLPFAALYFRAIHQDPLLMQWNLQNITLSTAWWDVLVAFSPAIPFAFGNLLLRKFKVDPKNRVLWIWSVIGLGFLILPISLQRRFLIGIYIPITILAWDGVSLLMKRFSRINLKHISFGYQIFAFPTNVLLIIIGIFGIIQKSPYYFLRLPEKQAIEWLSSGGTSDYVVFSDSQTSLFIPGMVSRRIVYAHPYETPGALQKQNYFGDCLPDFSTIACKNILTDENVKYILVNSLRIEIPEQWPEPSFPRVYSNGKVNIYEVE